MMRSIVIALCMVLSACSGLSLPSPAAAPAPLAATAVDDTALQAAWKSFDLALDGINLLIEHKVLVPGTPKAIKVADAIDKVVHFLTAAEKAAAAGSTTDYKAALIDAKGAITELRAALGGV